MKKLIFQTLYNLSSPDRLQKHENFLLSKWLPTSLVSLMMVSQDCIEDTSRSKELPKIFSHRDIFSKDYWEKSKISQSCPLLFDGTNKQGEKVGKTWKYKLRKEWKVLLLHLLDDCTVFTSSFVSSVYWTGVEVCPKYIITKQW